MNNIIKTKILEYLRSKRFYTKESEKVVKIPLNIDGRNFYVKWLKYEDNNLLYDLFLYEKFIVTGINTNFNKHKNLFACYIKLHQEFLKPNGAIELKKTIEGIVEPVYRQVFLGV